jgi:esterase/lipase
MVFICHSLGGCLLNNKIFSLTKKEDKFFFISPVVNERLNQKFIGKIINTIPKETKRFNLKNTTKEDLHEYYQELTSKIYSSSYDYSSQKNKTDSRILSMVGHKDELIVNKESHLILNGGHNLHIENPKNILSIILDKI